MKYAIMGDAHSNPAALTLALKDAKRRKCGQFVFLGDMTGYGYDAVSVIKLVRENFNTVIIGNHDAVCCGADASAVASVNPHYDIDRAQRRLISKTDVSWLRSLDYTCTNDDFAATHGDFIDPPEWGYIFEPEDAWYNFRKCRRELMFCAHSHHACIWQLDGRELENRFEEKFRRPATEPESISFKLKPDTRYIVNVGSVGYPRNDLCSTYVIYDSDSKQVTMRRLPFDFKGYIQHMVAAKVELPDWLREILLLAIRGG